MHVFTYGTLTLPEVMERVTGKSFDSGGAVLPGYQSFLLRGHIYPGMIYTGYSQAAGKVYYHVDEASLARIDVFEGDYYRRRVARPCLEGGAEIEAVAYILVDSLRYLLSDKPWSEEEFRKRYLRRYLGRG